MQNFFMLLVKKWTMENGVFDLCKKKKLLDSQIYPTTWTRKVKKSENEKKTKKRDMYCLDCEM